MINYMVDSENVGTKWIPYLKENIKKSDRVFLFYTDKSPSIPCNEIEELAALSTRSRQYIAIIKQQTLSISSCVLIWDI